MSTRAAEIAQVIKLYYTASTAYVAVPDSPHRSKWVQQPEVGRLYIGGLPRLKANMY
jgi:hypothetical protein